jgi:hypothetical protein
MAEQGKICNVFQESEKSASSQSIQTNKISVRTEATESVSSIHVRTDHQTQATES